MMYKIYTRKHNRNDYKYKIIYYDDIINNFNLPLKEASIKLGISPTSLKKICRFFYICFNVLTTCVNLII